MIKSTCLAPPVEGIVWKAADWMCREVPPELVGAILTGATVWLVQKIYADRQFKKFRERHTLYIAYQLARIVDEYRSVHTGSSISRKAADLKSDDIQRFRGFIGFVLTARSQIDDACEFAFMGKGKTELSGSSTIIQALDIIDRRLTADAAILEARIDCQISQILRLNTDDGGDPVSTFNRMMEPVVEHDHFTPAEHMEDYVNRAITALLTAEGLTSAELDDYRKIRDKQWITELASKSL